jgi:hypothetical protein
LLALLSFPAACVVSVVLGEYLCLQRELEAIPLTAEEREMRERRAATQSAANAAAGGGGGGGGHSGGHSGHGGGHSGSHGGHGVSDRDHLDAHLDERDGLLSQPQTPDGKAVTTTTIRLAPNNAFNV